MVAVTYRCPYCDAITALERPPRLADRSVTAQPIEGYEYAATTDDDRESADGIEFVCIGEDDEGCGRTFYLNFVKFENGAPVEDGPWLEDEPRFDFRP